MQRVHANSLDLDVAIRQKRDRNCLDMSPCGKTMAVTRPMHRIVAAGPHSRMLARRHILYAYMPCLDLVVTDHCPPIR